MGYTTKRKSTSIRRAPAKKRTATRRTMSIARTPRMQTMLASVYFEAQKQTDPNLEQEFGYSIRLDPDHLIVKGTPGVVLRDGTGANGAVIPAGTALEIPNWTNMKQLFNQYQIRGASATICCSSNGAEFPLIMSNDIGEEDACDSMKNAVSGAHTKSFISQTRREAKYGIKNTGQQLDFISTNGLSEQTAGNRRYLKVYHHLPVGNDVVQHGVTLYLQLALKDSKHLN